jgi:hypothetical protein
VTGLIYVINSYSAGDDFSLAGTAVNGTLNTNGYAFLYNGSAPSWAPTHWTNGSTIASLYPNSTVINFLFFDPSAPQPMFPVIANPNIIPAYDGTPATIFNPGTIPYVLYIGPVPYWNGLPYVTKVPACYLEIESYFVEYWSRDTIPGPIGTTPQHGTLNSVSNAINKLTVSGQYNDDTDMLWDYNGAAPGSHPPVYHFPVTTLSGTLARHRVSVNVTNYQTNTSGVINQQYKNTGEKVHSYYEVWIIS